MKVAVKCGMIVQDGIGISSKPDAVGDLIVTITIKTMMDAGTLARIVNLQKQKSPKYFELGSDQAAMDLFTIGVKSEEALEALNEMELDTGEGEPIITEDKLPITL